MIVTALSQLAELQMVDRELREKGSLLETLSSDIVSLEKQLIAQREATQAVLAERDSLESRRRLLEAQLQDEEGKMKDRRMRLNRVRNEKELAALRREIELGKEANQQMEEEIFRLLEASDRLQASASEAERAQAELEAQTITLLEENQGRIEAIRAELEMARQRRENMAESLDGDLLRKYEQIFARRGGLAVVEVRNAACSGCHMNLPPQFFNELQRATDIRLCPNCHRILYWRPELPGA